MKKMMESTIPDGEQPTLLLQGEKGKRYILSIDPNASNSSTADTFAMTVIEIDEDKFKQGKVGGTVVHNYAKFGKDLKDNVKYLFYLWTNFDIHMIVIDYAGYQFIESANENELFKKAGVEFKILEFHAEKDGSELEVELKKARREYNRSIHRIVFTQYFTSDFIRKGNEYLQGCIDYKKIWFASNIKADANSFDRAISADIDLSLTGVEDISQKDETDREKKSGGMTQLIDDQAFLVKQQKYQCASIEVKTTAKGTQSFDLPQVMKRNNTSTRMRKDSYTTLMLGCWALKQYFDLMNVPEESNTFTPELV